MKPWAQVEQAAFPCAGAPLAEIAQPVLFAASPASLLYRKRVERVTVNREPDGRPLAMFAGVNFGVTF